MSNLIPSLPEVSGRGISNATYLMFLLSNCLADWAKESPLSDGKNNLRFIVSIETDKLDDVHLSLSYTGPEGEIVIPAGYVGQVMTSKESKFCEKLPIFTNWDLSNKPPFSVITEKFKGLNDQTSLVEAVALAMHCVMVNSCEVATRISAALALSTSKGSAILFLRNKELYVTKIEIYVKDIVNFIEEQTELRSKELRQEVTSLICPKERKL